MARPTYRDSCPPRPNPSDSAKAPAISSTRPNSTVCSSAGRRAEELSAVIAKSMAKEALSLADTAVLAGGRRRGKLPADLRGRPAVEARRVRQPHRALRAALRGQQLPERLPVLRLPPLESRRRPPHAQPGRLAGPGRGPGAEGPQADDPGLRRAPVLQPRVHRRVRADGLFGQGRSRRDPPREHQRGPHGPRRIMPRSGRRESAPTRSSRRPIITRPMPRCIRGRRGRAIISGGSTPWPGRWRPAATTWASGPCSACTTGSSRCSGWWPMPCTCRSITTSGRTRSASRGCARPRA